MATKPLKANLAADLPTNWQIGQTIAPNGSDAGLSEQHGYNYQSAQINAAQQAVNTINDAFETVAAANHQHSPASIGAAAADHQHSPASIGAAPTSHSSSAATYGVGSTTNYGHVKVTNGQGLSINNGTIAMGSASATAPGAVTTGTQTIAGNKTLTGALQVNSNVTVTGGIKFTRGAWTGEPVIVKNDGDANGVGLLIGTGGLTFVGSGEAASNLYNALKLTGGTEQLHLGSDTTISLHVNCQTVANRKTITISAAGAMVVPSHTDYTTYKVRNISANTSAMTAGSTALTSGNIYLQYE